MDGDSSPPKDSKPDRYRLTREKRAEFEALVDCHGATDEQRTAWRKFFSRCQNNPPQNVDDASIERVIEGWHSSRGSYDSKQWDEIESSLIEQAGRKLADGEWNEKRCKEELSALRKQREDDRLDLLRIPDLPRIDDVLTAYRLHHGDTRHSGSRGITEEARFMLRALRHGGLSLSGDETDD